MAYPTVAAGQKVTAQNLRDMQWQSVDQGTQQDVISSTTLVNSNLTMTAVAGATYMYRLLISYVAAQAGGLQAAWTAPTNASVVRFTTGIGDASTGSADTQTAVNFRRPGTGTGVDVGAAGASFGHSYWEMGTILGGDGGTVTFQFAQAHSTATNTSVTGSSRLDWIRIG